MKILAIGDPHGKLPKKISKKDIDFILITGDLGKSDIWRIFSFKNLEKKKKGLEIIESPKTIERGYYEWFESSVKVLKKLSLIAPVYFVFGNIEKSNKDTREISKEIGKKLPFLEKEIKKLDITSINNRKRNLNGIKIGGIPFFRDYGWMLKFEPSRKKERGKEYKKDTNKEKKILDWFEKLDILITHIPPYGVLDKVKFKKAPKDWQRKHAGSKVILDYIKKYQPKLVLCGHIHEAKGEKMIGKTKVINLGCCGDYKIIEF